MQTAMRDTVDWADWARRWDVQQARGIIEREERFQIMLELVAEIVGSEPGLIFDLACGTGSISARVLERFPTARIVALDASPLLLRIGQGALGDGGGRLSWLRANLREAGWSSQLVRFGQFDVVLSTTAFHWLPASDLVDLYQKLAELLRPGGLFLNAEHLLVAPPVGRCAGAAQAVRKQLNEARPAEGEEYAAWWDAARADPSLGELAAEHDRIFPPDRPGRGQQLTAAFHEEALRQAGFAETAVLWRYLDNTIVGGIR